MPDEDQIPAEIYEGQTCRKCGEGMQLVDLWRVENIVATEDLLIQCKCPHCGELNLVRAKKLPPAAS